VARSNRLDESHMETQTELRSRKSSENSKSSEERRRGFLVRERERDGVECNSDRSTVRTGYPDVLQCSPQTPLHAP
jgi:hypothetical protein